GQIVGVGIADIALDDGEVRMRLKEIAEPHDIERHYFVSCLQQLRNENAALVAAGAGEKDLHDAPLGDAGAAGAPRGGICDGAREALGRTDVAVIAVRLDANDAADEARDDLGREVDHRPAEGRDRLDDLWLEKIDRSVGEIAGRIIDLLVKGGHGAAIIDLQDAAGAGSVGPEAEHGDGAISRPPAMRLDEAANVEV